MGCGIGQCENSTTGKICYTGKTYESIPIIAGDNLTQVMESIAENIEATNIFYKVNLNEIDISCENSLQGEDSEGLTLQKIIESVYKDICNLAEKVEYNTNFWYNQTNYPFDLGNLTVPSGKNGEIIQALLNKVNELQNEVNSIIPSGPGEGSPGQGDPNDPPPTQDETYIEQLINNKIVSFLKTNLKSCSKSINVTGSGSDTQFEILHTAPSNTILFGTYPLSWFDTNGRGKKTFGMCGWYLADGRNGTTDMRGFGAIGATNMNNSTPLHTKANNTPTSSGSVVGNKEYKIKVNNLPPHTHSIPSLNHKHQVQVPNIQSVTVQRAITPSPLTHKLIKFTNENNPYISINTNETDLTGATGTIQYPGGLGAQSDQALAAKPEPISLVEPNRVLVAIQRIDHVISTIVPGNLPDTGPTQSVNI